MKVILSEHELIRAIVNRSPTAAAALYDQYAATLLKVICCSVQDKETAGTVLEKTFVTIWNNIGTFQTQDQRLLLWMAGIARQLARKSN